MPLSTGMLYLFVGIALGPWGAGLIRMDPLHAAVLLERLTELAVIVSLFTAGLKLRLPINDVRWRPAIRLASVSMTVTVGLIAAVGYYLLDLPLGAAVLLGGILAPTDPVLASDVQVADPGDTDRLRFGLTGEAGLNDGSAFPFVLLGLGLLGLHDLGAGGWRWWTIDLLWRVGAGLGIGYLAGTLVAKLVLYLRRTHREAIGLDDFLSLGLLGLAYGAALAAHSYGFLAAFAAGAALRRIEIKESGGAGLVDIDSTDASPEELAGNPQKASAYMAHAVLGFNEQLVRIFELALVVLIGGLLTWDYLPGSALWFVPLLLLIIRPLSVLVGLSGADLTGVQRGLVGWFGIRGIGSLYYLTHAINHGIDESIARNLTGLTLATVAVSITVHGVSVTPLMQLYRRYSSRKSS